MSSSSAEEREDSRLMDQPWFIGAAAALSLSGPRGTGGTIPTCGVACSRSCRRNAALAFEQPSGDAERLRVWVDRQFAPTIFSGGSRKCGGRFRAEVRRHRSPQYLVDRLTFKGAPSNNRSAASLMTVASAPSLMAEIASRSVVSICVLMTIPAAHAVTCGLSLPMTSGAGEKIPCGQVASNSSSAVVRVGLLNWWSEREIVGECPDIYACWSPDRSAAARFRVRPAGF